MISILKKIGQFILDTIQMIVLSLSVFIIVYLFLFQPHQVKGSSMFPSFLDKEFLLTNKISYRFNSPQRGDVIIFKAPKSEPCSEIECEYIKRLIGLPGDRIMVKQSLVYLNGEQLNETDYLGNSVITSPGSFLSEGVEKIVPEGYILPLGDNRPYSRDGREFGFVSRDSIIGKAWLRYWPIEKIGFVKHENYN
ncbi:signal peptidase I [Candidatus Shapirobacteria bacterium CG09_land_8_20_14_0_10_39_12]|uniref:Signal peptidase I n=1 Tax=Candidatus Shapirobacteria bacterium CG09_land_8_20_14_0_10_39_12 TaxID=1974885 RepID=A0A2H0WQY5_9BACT|nr:MAG: signal peptidase I [Candidatus Shapirobacteria bacterium CG09_land_8_20_14_0_10_39_12]